MVCKPQLVGRSFGNFPGDGKRNVSPDTRSMLVYSHGGLLFPTLPLSLKIYGSVPFCHHLLNCIIPFFTRVVRLSTISTACTCNLVQSEISASHFCQCLFAYLPSMFRKELRNPHEEKKLIYLITPKE